MRTGAAVARPIFLLALAVTCLLLAPAAVRAQAAPEIYRGQIALLYGDQVEGGKLRKTTVIAFLLTESGEQFRLQMAPELLAASGGWEAVAGMHAEVAGTAGADGALHAASVTPLAGENLLPAARLPVLGNQRWILLACRGAGAAVVHETPAPFYDGVLGSDPYGADHFWRELSYGKIDLAGSRSEGWFDLPEPAAAYEVNEYGMRSLDPEKALRDCTAAADPTVDFSPYTGIILLVPLEPQAMSSFWLFGGHGPVAVDGQSRGMGLVWLPLEIGDGFAPHTTGADGLMHELGHAFGLPHSSGGYEDTYDSVWDLMSMSGAGTCARDGAVKYSCAGQHTIGVHKEWLGWLEPDQVLTLGANTAADVLLRPLAQPGDRGVLLIRSPIDGAGRTYTVEARMQRGYDKVLPAEAVIMHEVDDARRARPAGVVDPDHDGDPNDESAQWQPGERFDGEGGFSLCVKGRTPEGYLVSVARGRPLTCTFGPDLSPSRYTADSIFPSPGQTVTLALEISNYQAPAAGVVVTAAIPAGATYISPTATTSQGEVLLAEDGELVFAVGDVTWEESVSLTYDVVVDADVEPATLLTHTAQVTWQGGAGGMPSPLQLPMLVDGRRLHLPLLGR
jgi:uncharacterized repeat protein (TIGR01451 family)